MNKDEAQEKLSSVVQEYRKHTFDFWKSRIKSEPFVIEGTDATGNCYTIEIQSFWDGSKDGPIRVGFDIDYGGLSTFMPLCDGFIIAENGQFMDE